MKMECNSPSLQPNNIITMALFRDMGGMQKKLVIWPVYTIREASIHIWWPLTKNICIYFIGSEMLRFVRNIHLKNNMLILPIINEFGV